LAEILCQKLATLKLLDQSNSWQQDVKFVFKTSDGDGKEGGEVWANKLLLSLASEVFRAQFFGELSEKTEVGGTTKILVEDATCEGFRVLVQFMYLEDAKIIGAIKDLDLLFEIYKLADKYLFPGLQSVAKAQIEATPLSLDNAQVLWICARYGDLCLFEALCKDLFNRCVHAVRAQWKSVSSSLNFWSADYGDTEADKLALVKEMSQWCFDCQPPKRVTVQQLAKECRSGKKLTFADCRIGLAVQAEANIMSGADDDEPISAGSRGTISEIEQDEEGKMLRVYIEWGIEKLDLEHYNFLDIVFDEH
jgi:BTB/POZ domain